MTEESGNNRNTVLVALDIAKKTHDAIIALPSGNTIKLRVPNSLGGYQHLLGEASQGNYRIQVALEPTADYHRNIAYWLHEQGCRCFLVRSLSCARAREMLFDTWNKNDRKDAGVILYLMRQGLMKPFYDPIVSGTFDIQKIANTDHQISLARTSSMNSLLNHYITLYFPGIERFFRSSGCDWFGRFLSKFLTFPRSLRH